MSRVNGGRRISTPIEEDGMSTFDPDPGLVKGSRQRYG